MPKFNQLSEGKYLKKEDLPNPILVTIREYRRENVARDNEPEEFKWIAYFQERIGQDNKRGLVLNNTNAALLQLATGCESTEESLGRQIVLYNDPTISMGGKLVGGIRIRAPRNRPASTNPAIVMPAPSAPVSPEPGPFPAEPDPATGDDVPF